MLAAAVISCSTPTQMCGCPPARSAVFVIGAVVDAGGRPVADARLALDGVPPERAADFPQGGFGGTRSDAVGEFRTLAYSGFAPGMLELRAAVVRPGTADTVRLRLGPARFRDEDDRPDTVRASLRLP